MVSACGSSLAQVLAIASATRRCRMEWPCAAAKIRLRKLIGALFHIEEVVNNWKQVIPVAAAAVSSSSRSQPSRPAPSPRAVGEEGEAAENLRRCLSWSTRRPRTRAGPPALVNLATKDPRAVPPVPVNTVTADEKRKCQNSVNLL